MQTVVPWKSLPPDTLYALVEEFVTREGTDYGHQVFDTRTKVAHVMKQLESGRCVITFDSRLNTASIVPADKLGGADKT